MTIDVCIRKRLPPKTTRNDRLDPETWVCETRWFGGGLVLAGGAGLSAGNAADGPKNSHRAVFGVGWECAGGYRREGNGCAPVDLPENAHITAAGNIWEIGRASCRERVCQYV